ncbi:Polycomb protein Sfmbt, partial [Eumeta japonica]
MADDARNLKPPQSYEEETEVFDDLTALPLAKDSVTICQLCGCVGRRENFYPRDNKFCSLRCSSSFKRKRSVNWRFVMEGSESLEGYIPLEPLPQLQAWPATLHDLQ